MCAADNYLRDSCINFTVEITLPNSNRCATDDHRFIHSQSIIVRSSALVVAEAYWDGPPVLLLMARNDTFCSANLIYSPTRFLQLFNWKLFRTQSFSFTGAFNSILIITSCRDHSRDAARRSRRRRRWDGVESSRNIISVCRHTGSFTCPRTRKESNQSSQSACRFDSNYIPPCALDCSGGDFRDCPSTTTLLSTQRVSWPRNVSRRPSSQSIDHSTMAIMTYDWVWR